jgi:putative hydrolase of the HAD superfamily
MPIEARPGQVVVFDIDDTLYLERDYVASGFASVGSVVSARFGVAGFDHVAWRLFAEGHRGNIFNQALTMLRVTHSPADVRDLVHVYRTHRPNISLLSDARGAIADLLRCGVRLAILTDGPEASQAAKVDALGLRRYAEVVILTDSYVGNFRKPHRRGYEEIASRLAAVRLAYVADNPVKDFLAPYQLGWATIRTRRMGGLHEHVPSGADINEEIRDLRALPMALQLRGFGW